MKLTSAERLILMMLTEIYQKLGIKQDIDADFVQKMILDENEWAISWKYPGLLPNDKHSKEVSDVVHILEMWDIIEDSLASLSKAEKSELDNLIAPFDSNTKFEGFDGNNETKYMSITRCLIEDLDRFSRFKGRGLNSHMSESLNIYRRMLTVYEPLRYSLHARRFNVSELSRIILERVHPENRK